MENNNFALCPRCGYPIQAGTNFCPQCGLPIETEVSTPQYCPNCGKSALQGENFCSACGSAYTPYTTTNTAKTHKKWILISAISLVSLILIVGLLLTFLLILPAQKETYTIKIYTYCENGIRTYETYKTTITVEEGDVLGDISKHEGIHVNGILKPKFKGWYTDKAGTSKWNPYVDKVQSDMTIYGVYEKP